MTVLAGDADLPEADYDEVIAGVFGELAQRRQWVGWKSEKRGGDWTKVPKSPVTGGNASSTNSSTWGTLEDARYLRDERGLNGVGIVLGGGLGGVDLDDCRDPKTGKLTEWAQGIITSFASYTEVSPSGTGVKIFALGAPDRLPASTIPMDGPSINGKAPHVEVYVHKRYFTVTGRQLDGTPDEIRHAGDLGGAWDQLVQRLQEQSSRTGSRNRSPRRIPDSIRAGARNNDLMSIAGGLRRKGLDAEEIYATLTTVNERRGNPPVSDDEVRGIADGSMRYAAVEDSLTLTDSGNATRLVAMHGDRLHYIAPWKEWLVFDPVRGVWLRDHADVRVRELAKDVGSALKKVAAADDTDETQATKLFPFALKSLNKHGITGMVDLARGVDGIPLDHEDLDCDGWLLGVENGVVDLHTGTLRPADPDDLMTMQCPVSWDQDASAERWEQAMEEWFSETEVRDYVKRVAGSTLVGGQRDHVFIVHFGGGRNGKGTFTKALQRVLGPYATVIHLSLLVEQRHSQHDTVKAELFRSRLAVASETQKRVRLDEASVKNLTGGDRITARRMRENPWEFDPTHSLWLQTNHLPEISGRDTGIWSRIRVVKWVKTFDGKDQDRDLDETLAGEAPGILRWLVEGCLEWQEHELAEPEAVIRATLAYRESEDVLTRFASDTGLVFGPGLEIKAGRLQEFLTEWAQEEGVDTPRQDVGEWLRENGAQKKQRRVTGTDGEQKRPKFWVGIGFADEKHEVEQTDVLA